MRIMKAKKQGWVKGFTLIEMSIVLVVLALLTTAAYQGLALIEGAQLRVLISEKKKYETAWNAFREQYDALPGDFSEGYAYFANGTNDICGDNGGTDNPTCNGNGNSIMELTESVRAFRHLDLAGVLPGVALPFNYTHDFYLLPFPGEGSVDAVEFYNIPGTQAMKAKEAGWVYTSYLGYPTDVIPTNWYGRTGNWLQFGERIDNWVIMDGAALTQEQAHTLDIKIDDGFPIRGTMTAMNGSDNVNVNNVISPRCIVGPNVNYFRRDETRIANDANDPTVVYNIDGDNKSCVVHFYLGS